MRRSDPPAVFDFSHISQYYFADSVHYSPEFGSMRKLIEQYQNYLNQWWSRQKSQNLHLEITEVEKQRIESRLFQIVTKAIADSNPLMMAALMGVGNFVLVAMSACVFLAVATSVASAEGCSAGVADIIAVMMTALPGAIANGIRAIAAKDEANTSTSSATVPDKTTDKTANGIGMTEKFIQAAVWFFAVPLVAMVGDTLACGGSDFSFPYLVVGGGPLVFMMAAWSGYSSYAKHTPLGRIRSVCIDEAAQLRLNHEREGDKVSFFSGAFFSIHFCTHPFAVEVPPQHTCTI